MQRCHFLRNSKVTRDTDKDWKLIAEENPYWGVLSVDQYMGKRIDSASLERFFDSGKLFVGNVIGLIRAHIYPGFEIQRSLDFGCGVGRLLVPLAGHSIEAVGDDVAPAMLELCQEHLDQRSIKNCTLVKSDDELSELTGTFDFINTYIVLQHIPPDRGYRILAKLLSKLRVGGCASIQVTYAKSRKYLIHETGRARAYRRDGDTIKDLLPVEDASPEGRIIMYDYDLNQVVAMVSEIAGVPMIVLPTLDDDHLGVHFIFAKSR
jgi:2-polyprenyl-3-methyl-5-hydroxy-6-metoxy-1,4-benzoquinol methylase